MFIGDIFGYLGEYWGLTLIFNGYVNSDMRGAKTLSRKFCIYSNLVKIDECTKMILALSDRLQKKRCPRVMRNLTILFELSLIPRYFYFTFRILGIDINCVITRIGNF